MTHGRTRYGNINGDVNGRNVAAGGNGRNNIATMANNPLHRQRSIKEGMIIPVGTPLADYDWNLDDDQFPDALEENGDCVGETISPEEARREMNTQEQDGGSRKTYLCVGLAFVGILGIVLIVALTLSKPNHDRSDRSNCDSIFVDQDNHHLRLEYDSEVDPEQCFDITFTNTNSGNWRYNWRYRLNLLVISPGNFLEVKESDVYGNDFDFYGIANGFLPQRQYILHLFFER